jgi:hypothetical protein
LEPKGSLDGMLGAEGEATSANVACVTVIGTVTVPVSGGNAAQSFAPRRAHKRGTKIEPKRSIFIV